ncbi:MAG: hypothetical protein UY48_C0002G0012 [Candidatus Gottesmanbacteria bacterium GW2011_GWB1_49_7]|uniref:Holliday junction resolvase RuvC n=1 Tax=Candidatus Gottesmanbacteria bacterium GW2011_GWB1_49_7 TaxID=1618448 RepID=A0A0G1W3H9_9BACT|nr:MAG: hypothetical protein UY48_C0002G0012 [Candidatus Gottesmanbacteria bacterium GW2011_GWB1_49_7]
MTALGFDLGRHTAFAVLEHTRKGFRLVALERFDSVDDAARLQDALLALELPGLDVVAHEEIYHSRKHPTAHKARDGLGILRVVCQKQGWPAPQATGLQPQHVKETMTGDRAAGKPLVAACARGLVRQWGNGLPIRWRGRTADEFDAIAIAYTGLIDAQVAAVYGGEKGVGGE